MKTSSLFLTFFLCVPFAAAQSTKPSTAPVMPPPPWLEMQRQPAGPQTVVRVHDPCAIEAGGAFYLFSTGRGIPIFRSDDLYHWTRIGAVFNAQPAWASQEVPGSRGQWAPDISFFDGVYHLYYAVSTFGSRRSCIGLAINKSLDPNNSDYRWIDQGKVVETHLTDNYNAIDPNLIMDETGQPWLTFGSCWDGIRICRVDLHTGKPTDPNPPLTRLVHRPSGKLYEGPFIRPNDGWFYIFVSFDACCKGASSTYKVMVGRSKAVNGQYVDMDGVPMLEGGGTLVLGSYGDVRGPGHNGMITDAAGRDWMVHHFYDAADRGISKLQVRRVVWDKDHDGWPLVQEPVDRPIAPTAVQQVTAMTGSWRYSVDFGADRTMTLRDDGTIEGDAGAGRWQRDGQRLSLSWPRGKSAEKERTDLCTISDDGESFVGRDGEELVLRGKRSASAAR